MHELEDKHYLLYKPYGYLSQFVNNGPKKNTKRLLGELYDFAEGTMAVGRLDEDSEGLLLLTTDGKVSYEICSGAIEKEYYAQVDGIVTLAAIEKLQQGVEIGNSGRKYKTKPCHAFRLTEDPNLPKRAKKIRDSRHGPTSWVSITLTEGKFRQVKKMTAAVGFPTLRLARVRIGNLKIENMQAGEVIPSETLMV
ncbi:pseudouridine synthase [Marixanthomonas ophiurae]|uniref:Pseudouridine synthase n=1 Tax=Marixanthomonas ophiurae TaxID=387659 RepID=A0A3E1Q7W9_9FLAO|nr:pseudouridine synthase [Marixanthomonas ophiurae]RFN58225.1 pseudouridine synthase [Marixanthomonas ophiurae]